MDLLIQSLQEGFSACKLRKGALAFMLSSEPWKHIFLHFSFAGVGTLDRCVYLASALTNIEHGVSNREYSGYMIADALVVLEFLSE